jgi:hypothetical protein
MSEILNEASCSSDTENKFQCKYCTNVYNTKYLVHKHMTVCAPTNELRYDSYDKLIEDMWTHIFELYHYISSDTIQKDNATMPMLDDAFSSDEDDDDETDTDTEPDTDPDTDTDDQEENANDNADADGATEDEEQKFIELD